MAQVPYEFLVRWDHETGKLKGAHVKVYDNVAMREGDAQPVAVAGASGFPLKDILTAVQQGAIIAADLARNELAATKAELNAVNTELAVAKAAIAAMQSLPPDKAK